jgi:hypothetical protein
MAAVTARTPPRDLTSGDEYHCRLAAGELESWLRMNRTPHGWPATAYDAEVERLTMEYLTGVGWCPGARGRVWVAVADAVHEAGLVAWLRVTGTEPWDTGRVSG